DTRLANIPATKPSRPPGAPKHAPRLSLHSPMGFTGSRPWTHTRAYNASFRGRLSRGPANNQTLRRRPTRGSRSYEGHEKSEKNRWTRTRGRVYWDHWRGNGRCAARSGELAPASAAPRRPSLSRLDGEQNSGGRRGQAVPPPRRRR